MNQLHILTLGGLLALVHGQLYQREAKSLSVSRMQSLSGCFHDGRYYYERSLIPTVDSCINCKCEGGLVRCNMTLCPMYPTIQEGCHLSHEDGLCCPQLTCDETVAKKMAQVPAIHEATLLGCTYNDVEFGLGDFIPTSDPCQACYCIHNRTQCVHQNCALPESAREGCRPVYHHGVCCPIRYDCSEAQSSPPTLRPPFLTEGCAVNNRFYDEGEAIPSGKPCEHCYCMKGEMICAMQKCDSPMAGCVPVLKNGQCCPERYECPNTDANMIGDSSKTGLKSLASFNVSYHGNVWNGQRLTSTTRGLEDDSESGEYRITTASSVSVTSPLSVISTTKTAEAMQRGQLAGYPTAVPTQAVLGFNESVFNASTFQKGLAAGRNPSLTVVNGSHETSDADVPINKVLPEDLLHYTNVLTTKVGIVPLSSTSDFFNSADTLGTRPPSTTPATANTDHLELHLQPDNQSVVINQTHSSSVNSNNMSQNPDDRLITHIVDGTQSLGIITSSSDQNDIIQLNTRINVTASSPTESGLKLSLNGVPVQGPSIATAMPTAVWNNVPTPYGNHTRKPVLPAPLDPTASDPIEGLIRFFSADSSASAAYPSAQPNPLLPILPEAITIPSSTVSAIEPIGPNDPEPEISHDFTNNITSPVAFAHLTQMGLAIDPSASDEIEGLISGGNIKAPSNLLLKVNTSVPIDPESAAQVEGVAASGSGGVAFNSDGVASVAEQLHANDQHPPKNTLPVDHPQPVDPSLGAILEGSDAIARNMTFATPLDPSIDAEVEGVLGLPKAPANLSMISNAKVRKSQGTKLPLDPNATEIEGAIIVTTAAEKVRSAPKPSVNAGMPVDPVGSDQIEGALTADQNAHIITAAGNVKVPKQQQNASSTRNKIKVINVQLQPVEPSSQDTVEGIWQLSGQQPGAGDMVLSTTSTVQPLGISVPQVVHRVAGQFALGGAVINQKRTMTIAAENVTLSSSSPILGSTLISVRLNGSVPVPLMLALNSAKSTQPIVLGPTEPTPASTGTNSQPGWDVSNGQGWGKLAINKGWGSSSDGNRGWGSSSQNQDAATSVHEPSPTWSPKPMIPRPLAKPVEPLHEDDYEGLLRPQEGAVGLSSLKPAGAKTPVHPLDPLPSDQFEGMENHNAMNKMEIHQEETTALPTGTTTVGQPTVTRVLNKIPILPARFTTKPPQVADRWSTTTGATATTTTTMQTTTSAPTISSTAVELVSSPEPSSALPLKPANMVTEIPADAQATGVDADGSMFNGSLHAVASSFPNGQPLTGIYENGCYFEGNYYRNYQAISTDDLVDPCLVRVCKDGIVFGPSVQRCPPPIPGCFSTSIPGVCCPVYLCPNYLERNETSYTLTAAAGDQLNTEKTRLALAKFCRVGPRFLALNERVVHVMGVQCQTCTCKQKGIVCEPGCAQNILITTLAPLVQNPRRFQTISTTPATTTSSTPPPITEPLGSRSCTIQKKKFHHGDEVTFNDPCHMCTCLDGLVICKMNRKACRSAKLLGALDAL
ncbi:LOW QUALITY PROTEIN: uncharacterized protein LOC129581003 [Paramacrobiotus metropolitanus]|uniref:LOW QUALITY PROTEIN: uncharacterized protein LOC129581003 n=1 Tax=Paramacrobiotus metropolitanus TaxID=2943436 RepID=UPI002445A20A|nr:LOW QUALITY PROTEIN: uncharacterized protein LOC129581003 [Paramacrobiotus metropolitanus]